MSLQKIIAVSPTEIQNLSCLGFPLCIFAYHLGPMLHLYRSGQFTPPAGSILGIHKIAPGNSFSLSRCVWEIAQECKNKKYRGIFPDDETVSAPLFRSLVHALSREMEKTGITIYLPEKYEGLAPLGKPVLTTAVSGGSLRLRLTEAAEKYGSDGFALDMEPVCHRFSLPAIDGQGTKLTNFELRQLLDSGVQTFYSQDLCVNYFTVKNGEKTDFVLYDTKATFEKKLALAQTLSVKEAFFLYSETKELL